VERDGLGREKCDSAARAGADSGRRPVRPSAATLISAGAMSAASATSPGLSVNHSFTRIPNPGPAILWPAGRRGLMLAVMPSHWSVPLVGIRAGGGCLGVDTRSAARELAVAGVGVEIRGRGAAHVEYAYRLAVDAPAAEEIRLFGLAGWAVDRFASRRRRLTEALFHERRLRMRPMRWSLGLIVLGNAGVFGSLAGDAIAGSIGLGSLVAFAQATIGTSSLAFGEFVWWFRQSAQPIPKVLDLADRMEPAGSLASGRQTADRLPRREIRFRNVRFAYPATNAAVLDGFDIVIPAGASLAIVGPNGAGKTTPVKLLCRLYDP
jgi:ABC transporter family protein